MRLRLARQRCCSPGDLSEGVPLDGMAKAVKPVTVKKRLVPSSARTPTLLPVNLVESVYCVTGELRSEHSAA
jgi:hypothetical protein